SAVAAARNLKSDLARGEAIRFEPVNVVQLGDLVFKSEIFPDCKSAAEAVVKILAGRELGIGPFAAMKEIFLVNGNVNLSAALLARLIKNSGRYDYRVNRLDDEAVLIVFYERRGSKMEKLGESLFTKRDAIAAGLAGRETYKKFPRNMLFARALLN